MAEKIRPSAIIRIAQKKNRSASLFCWLLNISRFLSLLNYTRSPEKSSYQNSIVHFIISHSLQKKQVIPTPLAHDDCMNDSIEAIFSMLIF